jgi:hypothetical protein
MRVLHVRALRAFFAHRVAARDLRQVPARVQRVRIPCVVHQALGEKDRMQGKGISAAESRAQLAAARQRRK